MLKKFSSGPRNECIFPSTTAIPFFFFSIQTAFTFTFTKFCFPYARTRSNSKIRCTVYKGKKENFHKATGPLLSQTHGLKLFELVAVNLVHGVINGLKAFSRHSGLGGCKLGETTRYFILLYTETFSPKVLLNHSQEYKRYKYPNGKLRITLMT